MSFIANSPLCPIRSYLTQASRHICDEHPTSRVSQVVRLDGRVGEVDGGPGASEMKRVVDDVGIRGGHGHEPIHALGNTPFVRIIESRELCIGIS